MLRSGIGNITKCPVGPKSTTVSFVDIMNIICTMHTGKTWNHVQVSSTLELVKKMQLPGINKN